jgi:uncharacterized protein YraI
MLNIPLQTLTRFITQPIQRSASRIATIATIAAIAGSVFVPLAPVAAQTDPTLILNDQTPSIDVVINPTNGAPGVIYLELENAQFQLTSNTGAIVLTAVDSRISAVGVQLSQGATAHTLHVERLAGQASARVKISAQTLLPPVVARTVAQPVAIFNVPTASNITVAPSVAVPVTVSDQANMVSLQFPQQEAAWQIADQRGTIIIGGIAGSGVNGLTVRLATDLYVVSMLNRDPTASANVLMALSAAPSLTLGAASSSATAEPTVVTPQPTSATAQQCMADVIAISVNVRSGPGTAYSILGYAAQKSQLPVGGTNQVGGWWLVQASFGAGWISASTAQLSGTCENLTVYDIPLRNTQPPIIVQQPPTSANGGNASPTGNQAGETESHTEGDKDD